jgi:hypothetical protein
MNNSYSRCNGKQPITDKHTGRAAGDQTVGAKASEMQGCRLLSMALPAISISIGIEFNNRHIHKSSHAMGDA